MTKSNTSVFSRFWHNKPVRWSLFGILLPISGIMTAYAVTEPMPKSDVFQVKRITEELPPLTLNNDNFQSSYWTEETVRDGDKLADVLKRVGIPQSSIDSLLVKSPIDKNLKTLRTGQTVSVRLNSMGDATDIQFFNDDDNGERNLVAIEKVNGKWRASASEPDMQTMPSLRSVIVRTSARGALAQAGVPVEVRESLSEIFQDHIDIDSLKSGDSIRLLYDSMYFRGQEMATGDILAAEITKNGKTYQAYYFGKDDDQGGSYYDQQGNPLKQKESFSTQPVAYTRISSPFGLRYHPVLHTIKMHTGIDYAAPVGTPIHAPADGTLIFRGWKGGYGNAVMLHHSNGVETIYGHMSAFAATGSSVHAGDVIGFVGSTGRSTGPHLHYEARVNGQPVNPTTVALPTPKLDHINMAAFRRQQKSESSKLAVISRLPVTVAQTD